MRKVTFTVIFCLIIGALPIYAQSTTPSEADLFRDIVLSIPPAAKAGVMISSVTAGLISSTNAPDPYPFPLNLLAYSIVAGLVTTSIGEIVSAWSDRPVSTQVWRRVAFGVDTAGALFAVAMIVADFIQPDPSGSAVLPLLSVLGVFGALMIVDLFPFSTEVRAGIRFGL